MLLPFLQAAALEDGGPLPPLPQEVALYRAALVGDEELPSSIDEASLCPPVQSIDLAQAGVLVVPEEIGGEVEEYGPSQSLLGDGTVSIPPWLCVGEEVVTAAVASLADDDVGQVIGPVAPQAAPVVTTTNEDVGVALDESQGPLAMTAADTAVPRAMVVVEETVSVIDDDPAPPPIAMTPALAVVTWLVASEDATPVLEEDGGASLTVAPQSSWIGVTLTVTEDLYITAVDDSQGLWQPPIMLPNQTEFWSPKEEFDPAFEEFSWIDWYPEKIPPQPPVVTAEHIGPPLPPPPPPPSPSAPGPVGNPAAGGGGGGIWSSWDDPLPEPELESPPPESAPESDLEAKKPFPLGDVVVDIALGPGAISRGASQRATAFATGKLGKGAGAATAVASPLVTYLATRGKAGSGALVAGAALGALESLWKTFVEDGEKAAADKVRYVTAREFWAKVHELGVTTYRSDRRARARRRASGEAFDVIVTTYGAQVGDEIWVCERVRRAG